MKIRKDHVAAITGAASGMGRSLALALAGRGVHVALADVNGPGLEETRAAAEALGVRATAAVVDVADRAAVMAWADAAAEAHGAVHLIFNNAGVATGALASTMTDEYLDWTLGINLRGVIHGTQAFLPHLRRAGEGHVVNTSSIFGLIGVPAVTPYNISKFGVRAFTECLAMELAIEGAPIGVTSVHPGGIKTAIARTSRIAPDLVGTYMDDADRGRRNFEKLFMTTADDAARIILRGVERNRLRVLVGPDAHVVDWLQRLFPSGYQTIVRRGALRQFKGRKG